MPTLICCIYNALTRNTCGTYDCSSLPQLCSISHCPNHYLVPTGDPNTNRPVDSMLLQVECVPCTACCWLWCMLHVQGWHTAVSAWQTWGHHHVRCTCDVDLGPKWSVPESATDQNLSHPKHSRASYLNLDKKKYLPSHSRDGPIRFNHPYIMIIAFHIRHDMISALCTHANTADLGQQQETIKVLLLGRSPDLMPRWSLLLNTVFESIYTLPTVVWYTVSEWLLQEGGELGHHLSRKWHSQWERGVPTSL